MTRALAIAVSFLVVLCGGGCYPVFQRMPRGTSYAGAVRPTAQVSFLADLTYVDPDGLRHVDQRIFDEVFRIIGGAERFVLVDMFLYNDFQGERREDTRALSAELTEALIRRKRERPQLIAIAISDPVNTVYGGLESKHFEALREADIPVVVTRLDRLRDSNPTYSGLWRVLVRPFGNSRKGGVVPSPFDDRRGAQLRILLDPNKDAFGYEKNGVPNRPVAAALQRAGVPVRWCDTHGEQCHAKMLLSRRSEGEALLVVGSANFTRRNLQDYNLETSVAVWGPQTSETLRDAAAYFDLVWSNDEDRIFSTSYETYGSDSPAKKLLYEFEESTGLGTF
jgi:hypothetical protein